MNGVRTEEVSVVRPVPVQQRSGRLSFLNKRKSSGPLRESTLMNGDGETPVTSPTRTMSRDAQRRASFFRVSSGDSKRAANTEHPGASAVEDERRPSQASGKDESGSEGGGPGVSKRGSVRKRLSMLRLGRKSSKAGLMGSLDEE